MSKIKTLASETALYGLGSILPRALNFLLVPLHTRNLFSPDQYGVVTNLLAYVAFLNILYMFGMETTYFRFATVAGTDVKRVFNLTQTTVVVISLVLTIFFVAQASALAVNLHIPAHPEFIIWLALVMFVDALVAIPFARLRLEKKPLKFAAAKIINILVVIGLNYYFLKVNYDPGIGVGYVFLAMLCGNAFYLIFFARDLLAWRPAFDRKMSAEMFVYAYPIMLTGVAGMTNEMFSRLTLEWWLPPNFYGSKTQAYALGLFGAGYKYAVLMSVAIQAFRFAAEPFFFTNASDKNSPVLFAKVNHYFVIVCCLLMLAVSINMDLFKYLVGQEYWEALTIVPILLLAYLFLGMYYNFSVWFKLTNKTYWGTIITVGGAALTILLNFVLIPMAGYTGSSWAALLVYLLMAIACYWIGQKYYPIPYHLLADFSYIGVTIALVYIVDRISIDSLWLRLGLHSLVLFLFIGVTYWIEGRAEPRTKAI